MKYHDYSLWADEGGCVGTRINYTKYIGEGMRGTLVPEKLLNFRLVLNEDTKLSDLTNGWTQQIGFSGNYLPLSYKEVRDTVAQAKILNVQVNWILANKIVEGKHVPLESSPTQNVKSEAGDQDIM